MRPRDNPFRASRIEALRFRPPGMSWDELLDRLAASNGRGAVTGPHGAGKTTCLEEIGRRLAAGGQTVVWFRAENAAIAARAAGLRRLVSAPANAVFLIDGADALWPGGWRLLRRWSERAAGLVVTSHRPGLLPTLVRCETTPGLFRGLLAELVPAADIPAEKELARLFQAHQGNIRAMFGELYGVWAEK